jgi:hypothetical protein
MVKFNRQAVADLIRYNAPWEYDGAYIYAYVTLTVTGNLNDDTQFRGSDTIKQ